MSAEEFLSLRTVHHDRLFPTAKETEGTTEFLTQTSKNEITLGLATSSHKVHCDMKISQRIWRPFLKTIVCGDDLELKKGKPAPDIFLLCADRMNVDPTEIIVFEDSRNGVLAAKAAGMTVIALNSPYIGPGDLDEAELIIENFRELL